MAATVPATVQGQDHPHYTMFMYNKLMYNAGYAGSRNVTSVNAMYRSQWVGIDGAPKGINVNIDGPVGNYMKGFRKVALGLSINNEKLGVTNNTNISTYYAYRVPLEKSVLSFGLQAGFSMYTANYNELNPYQSTDRVLTNNVKNSFLPNAGLGVFWSSQRHYLGFSVPNLFENYYDKDQKNFTGGKSAKQTRSYFLSGGYGFPVNDNFTLMPQFIARYAGNSDFSLPLNADINLAAIIYSRLMIGATYRTDKSIEGIVHVQATKMINIGYSYDYTASQLSGYNRGTHEITVGVDFIRDLNKYINPRFIRNF